MERADALECSSSRIFLVLQCNIASIAGSTRLRTELHVMNNAFCFISISVLALLLFILFGLSAACAHTQLAVLGMSAYRHA
eukprot:2282-Heterococcus_DN1.PRE.4